MELKDILSNLDRTEKGYISTHVLDCALNVFADNFDWEGFEKQDRLTLHYLKFWYDTDAYVGYEVFYFDNKPVCLAFRSGRKMGYNFKWSSKEDYEAVKDYYLSFNTSTDSDKIDLIDFDEDFETTYKLRPYQVTAWHKENAYYKDEKVKIVKFKPYEYDKPDIVTIQFENKKQLELDINELDFKINLQDNA